MKRFGTLAAVGVVALANAVALLEVVSNRRSGAVETIQLTERELPVDFRQNENSGVSVHLDWSRGNVPNAANYPRFKPATLRELGFNVDRVLNDPLHTPPQRPAFIAFEYAGPEWEKWSKSRNEANRLPAQSEMLSRLIPIDAALRPEPLLQRYPDHARYLIVKGLIQVFIDTTGQGPPEVRSMVSELLPGSIHVPPPLTDSLGRFTNRFMVASPRYTVTISYGRDFEPWIVTKP